MDILALPRRDLQALCKRNGVRANMTNAAMAEALAALPTVDGIGEYVKESVAVPAPEDNAAEEEEQQREKQGSPLPRGRRVTVEAVATNGGKEDEKRELAKEDAVRRRGPSRRAGPAPVVASSAAVPVGKAEEAEGKQGGSKEEDPRREANNEDPLAPVVGRRAASRRARPESATDSAGAGAVEEQGKKDGIPAPRGRRGAVKSSEPIRLDDCEEEEKELKWEAGMDGAPSLGVGRRGASRRSRLAPALAEPAGKVIEEEKAPPIPRGRHVKGNSTEPIKLNDEEEDKKAATKPEEDEDVPALDVGRRVCSQRVRHAPAVAAVAGKVAAEDPRAPIPRGHGVKVKSPEVISLDDREDEEKEGTKPDEMDDEAPAFGVGRRGASRRTPAPVEAPVTRRRAATSKAEAVGVTEEAVPIRATRQRKPTMKAAAAAAAEEKVLPKATRRKVVKKTISQQEEQEKPQEPVSAPVSDLGCDNPEDPEEDSGPQNREQKQNEEDVVTIEDEILMEETPAQELLVNDQESMDHSTLQGQQVGVEKCPAPLASQEDSPIMGLVSMATEQAAHKDEGANFQDGEGSSRSLDKGVFQEIHDADEEMEMVSIIQRLKASLTEEHIDEFVADEANHELEMGNFNEVPHGTEEISDVLVSQNKEDINIDELQADLADGSVLVDCSGNIKLFVEEETNEVNTEDVVSFQKKGDVAVDMALRNTVADAIPSGCSSDISCVEVEKAGDITSDRFESPAALDEVPEFTRTGGVVLEEGMAAVITEEPHSSGKMDENYEEEQFETAFVHADQVLTADSVPDLKITDCEPIEEDKTTLIIDEKQQSTITMDEDVAYDHFETDAGHADEPKKVITAADEVPVLTGTDYEVVEEDKAVVIAVEVPQSTGMDEDVEEDQFQTFFVHAEQVFTCDSVFDLKITDCEEKTTLIIDEKQQSTVTTDEATEDEVIVDDQADAYKQMELFADDNVPEQAGTDRQVVALEKAAAFTEEMPQSRATMDEDAKEDKFQAVSADQAITMNNVLKVKRTDDKFVDEETAWIADEMQQSTVIMNENVVDEHFETGVVQADGQEQVVDEVPELTRTVREIFEEDKAVVMAEEVPQSSGTMGDAQKKGVVDDNGTEMIQTEVDIVDLPQQLCLAGDSSDYITSALDIVTESLSKSIITLEPKESLSKSVSVCENSTEKNTTELVAMQDEKVVKVNKNSVDLYAFSLRQLKTKLKEGLNAKKNKEAKRVALARVDKNVCRSHSKVQQQNLNLQQH